MFTITTAPRVVKQHPSLLNRYVLGLGRPYPNDGNLTDTLRTSECTPKYYIEWKAQSFDVSHDGLHVEKGGRQFNRIRLT